MATYAKSGDVICLVFSRAEANALLALVESGDDHISKNGLNGSTRTAMDRALRTVSVACEPGSRSGASIS